MEYQHGLQYSKLTSGKILIDPQRKNLNKFFTNKNVKTGNTLLHDLMEASEDKTKPIRYFERTIYGDKEIEAHVSYFKAFDWYICVAMPVSEIQKPAESLIRHQSIVIALIFLGSLIVAFFLVSEISRPLNRLTSYVKDICLPDFVDVNAEKSSIDEISIKSKDEIGRLSESFFQMRTELKKIFENLLKLKHLRKKHVLRKKPLRRRTKQKTNF